MSGRVKDGGAWHEGHVLGGYQNPACSTCRAEERRAEAWRRKDRAKHRATPPTPASAEEAGK